MHLKIVVIFLILENPVVKVLDITNIAKYIFDFDIEYVNEKQAEINTTDSETIKVRIRGTRKSFFFFV